MSLTPLTGWRKHYAKQTTKTTSKIRKKSSLDFCWSQASRSSPRARKCVAHVLAAPIRALTTRFATGLINQAAHDLWDKLTTLLGSGWHWPF